MMFVFTFNWTMTDFSYKFQSGTKGFKVVHFRCIIELCVTAADHVDEQPNYNN